MAWDYPELRISLSKIENQKILNKYYYRQHIDEKEIRNPAALKFET